MLEYNYTDDTPTPQRGLNLTKQLIQLVNSELHRDYGCDSEEKDVIILRSHNEKKFSIHLIFTKAIFLNNKACKHFIRTKIMENRPEFQNDANVAKMIK